MVAYAETSDERGYRINHRERVLKSASEYAKKPLELLLARCIMKGAGVGGLELEKALIEPQKALEVLRVMNARGWAQTDFIQSSSYSGFHASVAPENTKESLWSWCVEGLPAGYADSLSEAKLLCARAIADQL